MSENFFLEKKILDNTEFEKRKPLGNLPIFSGNVLKSDVGNDKSISISSQIDLMSIKKPLPTIESTESLFKELSLKDEKNNSPEKEILPSQVLPIEQNDDEFLDFYSFTSFQFEDDEYYNEITELLRVLELRHQPSFEFMKIQKALDESHRFILMQWLIGVHDQLNLSLDTYFLTVNIIDRMLSSHQISKKKFQLVGIAATMIAAKYEEIHPPRSYYYPKLSCETFSMDQILTMENLILHAMNWSLSIASPQTFLTRWLQARLHRWRKSGQLSDDDVRCFERLKYLSEFYVELSSLYLDSYLFCPSLIANGSLLLSGEILNDKLILPYLNIDTNNSSTESYSLDDVKDCARYLYHISIEYLDSSSDDNDQCCLRKKYSNEKHLEVFKFVKMAGLLLSDWNNK